MARPLASGILSLSLLLWMSTAHAQRTLDVQQLRPTPDRDGFLGFAGTRTPGPWNWNAALWVDYASEPLTVRRADDGTRIPILAHRAGADLVAQLGLLGRFAVVLDVPMVLWQDADPAPLDGGPAISAVAIRDPYFAARARILGAETGNERIRNEGEGLAVQVGWTIPAGLTQSFAGEGDPQVELQVLGDFHFLDFGVGAMLGYRHRFAEPRVLGVPYANELLAAIAVQTPTILIANLSAIFEMRIATAIDRELFYGPSTPIEGNAALRWAEGDIALTWAAGMGWSGGVGAPGFRGIFGIEFAPRTHDADSDGIRDEVDDCARIPEDFDEHEDTDGCPDPDNDGDLVPDEDDRCRNEAAELGRDEDDDGCTDPVGDADSDSIPDDADRCPAQPEDRDGWQDEDGCADVDDDGDEILDAQDRCPREAEDRDGFEDADGCPDPDNDGDGVGDGDDGCPLEAEDRDGFEDTDGCPDPDNDRDGVADAEDRCADRAEDVDGAQDNDGCPEPGGRALWTLAGEVLSGSIRFAPDGTVSALSGPALDQLARHLVARWGRSWALELAVDDARLEAVRAALESRGAREVSARLVVRRGEGLTGTRARLVPR
ncbi:MAG: hypothetical protein IT378_11090 [Sandaracinaceae bacterium]|nr:hypothetical protein [Sandaracinaceae bacterium]